MSVTSNALTRRSQLVACFRDIMDRVLSELGGLEGLCPYRAQRLEGLAALPHFPLCRAMRDGASARLAS